MEIAFREWVREADPYLVDASRAARELRVFLKLAEEQSDAGEPIIFDRRFFHNFHRLKDSGEFKVYGGSNIEESQALIEELMPSDEAKIERLVDSIDDYIGNAKPGESLKDYWRFVHGYKEADAYIEKIHEHASELMLYYLKELDQFGYFTGYTQANEEVVHFNLNSLIAVIAGTHLDLDGRGIAEYIDSLPDYRYDTIANVTRGELNQPQDFDEKAFKTDPYIESYAHVYSALTAHPGISALVALNYIRDQDEAGALPMSTKLIYLNNLRFFLKVHPDNVPKVEPEA